MILDNSSAFCLPIFFQGDYRMRKAFFVLICALIPAGVFAEAELLEKFERNTAEGKYFVELHSLGKNLGQQTANELIRNDRNLKTVEAGITLSNVKWDLIRQALDRYRHRSGDTYVITLYNSTGNPANWFYIVLVAEYTSAAQYKHWAWLVYNASGLPLHPPMHFPPPTILTPIIRLPRPRIHKRTGALLYEAVPKPAANEGLY
jgi:hypothetical protein